MASKGGDLVAQYEQMGMPRQLAEQAVQQQQFDAINRISSGMTGIGNTINTFTAANRGVAPILVNGGGGQAPSDPLAPLMTMMRFQALRSGIEDAQLKRGQQQRQNEAYYGITSPGFVTNSPVAQNPDIAAGNDPWKAMGITPFAPTEKGQPYAGSGLINSPDIPSNLRQVLAAMDADKGTSAYMTYLGKQIDKNDPTAPIKNFGYRGDLVKQYGESSPEVNRFDNYVRALQTANLGDRTVVINPAVPGQPAATLQRGIPPEDLPTTRGAQANAVEVGKAQGQAQTNLPNAEVSREYVTKLIDDLSSDPHLGRVTGFGSLLPTVPGYNAATRARIDQLKGNNFLQAYQSLKGGGQITEVEGAKAEQAQARLNVAQTEQEFKDALKEMRELVQQRFKVQQRMTGMSAGGGTNTTIDALLKKYGGQ